MLPQYFHNIFKINLLSVGLLLANTSEKIII